MFSHYTAALYGLVAVVGQGTWVCPTFTALMSVSTIVQSKGREEFRGKQLVTKCMYGLEWLAFSETLWSFVKWPLSKWSVPCAVATLYGLKTYHLTRQVGIPGRAAYMGVHVAAAVAVLCLLQNKPDEPKKLLDLM